MQGTVDNDSGLEPVVKLPAVPKDDGRYITQQGIDLHLEMPRRRRNLSISTPQGSILWTGHFKVPVPDAITEVGHYQAHERRHQGDCPGPSGLFANKKH